MPGFSFLPAPRHILLPPCAVVAALSHEERLRDTGRLRPCAACPPCQAAPASFQRRRSRHADAYGRRVQRKRLSPLVLLSRVCSHAGKTPAQKCAREVDAR